MLVFGGILEVTKELNDLLAYDFKNKSFHVIDHSGDVQTEYHSRLDDSTLNPNLDRTGLGGNSPKKRASPARKPGVSPSKKPTMQQTLTLS